MALIKKTLKQVDIFISEAKKYESANPKPTKPLYAITRMLSRIDNMKVFKAYEDKLSEVSQSIADVKTKYQATNSSGHLLYEDDECKIKKFTPENEIICRKEVVDINKQFVSDSESMFEKEIEVEPFIIEDSNFLKSLTFQQIEAFRGFVIPEDFEPDFES